MNYFCNCRNFHNITIIKKDKYLKLILFITYKKYMKIILGLNCYHADSAACIIKNGKLIAAIEEERIFRIKHWAGFPINSIHECLKMSNLIFQDITDIAINTNPKSNIFYKIIFFLNNFLFSYKIFEVFKRYKNKFTINNLLKKNLN